ncbi:hypothetical protein K458DRAFT_379755 [Lentithecium fluviatile CBS 122367]|uniref:Uncharacterized protein n=1 Tax=Lentithecium fluviatile CBS 122367 TaxID=1168545 RepID=A0A6G1IEH9_9PLEO|nr:hypothetical protein K458DRAFT_379755 [Lentithecium fluviatile CBS 122367]
MGLWERVQNTRKQSSRDKQQDSEIKQLRETIEKAEKRGRERDEDRERMKRQMRGGGRDEIGENFQQSGALIQRQFDEGYGRLGRRFAEGDTVTENLLQKQIITLQQTVINVLQDALYNKRELTRADMAKLVAASDAAREGSLSALRSQQQRLALEEPAGPFQASPQRALTAPKRTYSIIESDPLFCRYSLNLQYIPKKPLAASFAPGGECRCPDCGIRLGVASDDFWQIGKRTPILVKEGSYEKEVLETREFRLAQRFVIKCHTAEGEFACVLCNRHRERDALCRTVEALVNHVGKFHEVHELECDADLRETMPLALAPPPPASVAGSVRDRERERGIREAELREYRPPASVAGSVRDREREVREVEVREYR